MRSQSKSLEAPQFWHRDPVPAHFCMFGMVALGVHTAALLLVLGALARMGELNGQILIWTLCALATIGTSWGLLKRYESPSSGLLALVDVLVVVASVLFGISYLFASNPELADEADLYSFLVLAPPVLGMGLIAFSRFLLLFSPLEQVRIPPLVNTGDRLLKRYGLFLLVLAPPYVCFMAIYSFFEAMKNFAP